MEKAWKAGLRRCYGASSSRKWYKLSADVYYVAMGLKPAYLLDTLKPDPSLFCSLLNYVFSELLRQGKHHVSDKVVKWQSELRVVSVGSDVVLVNLSALRDLFQESHQTLCAYVDIGKPLSQHGSTCSVCTDSHIHLHCFSEVEDKCRQWYSLLLETETSLTPAASCSGSSETASCLRLMAVEPTPDLNVCALFGRLLGYPVVYWFPPSIGYSLDHVELVNYRVSASSKDHGAAGQEMHSVKVLGYIQTAVNPKVVLYRC